MSEHQYQIGDYVYIEDDPSQPYLIRKIEELQKVSNEIGTVCKVTCFFRRRDIPVELLKLADRNVKTTSKFSLLPSSKQHQNVTDDQDEVPTKAAEAYEDTINVNQSDKECFGGLPAGAENLSAEDLHCLQQHEVFLSRQLETLQAKNIRGKCSVVFLSDVDTPEMYIKNDDHFFYSLIYDESNETLMSDKRTVQIGPDHQAVIDPETPAVVLKRLMDERKRRGFAKNDTVDDEPVPKKQFTPSIGNVPILPNNREALLFHPHHNLHSSEIDQFLILSKAVGTFARALDVPSVTTLPTLHVAAAAASRDTTQFHAMSLLHQSDYDIGKASQYLVPPVKLYKNERDHILDAPAPLLCRDELEYWSPAESHIFVEALEKCNKDFHEIRQNYLPWKSSNDIVEYYYMYKTSDRYAALRGPKKDSLNRGHLKHVYILPYTKPSPSLITDLSSAIGSNKISSLIPCESCTGNESNNWYDWGPSDQKMRLCQNCWNYWKKRGGLKRPHESERYHFKALNAKPRLVLTEFQAYQQQQPATSSVSIFGVNGQQNAIAFIPPIISSNLQTIVSPSPSFKIPKTFFFRSTILHKLARRLATKNIYVPRKAALNPFKELDARDALNNLFDRDPVSLIGFIRKNFGTAFITPSFIELIARHCRSNLQLPSHC